MGFQFRNERIRAKTLYWLWFLVGAGCLYIFHSYVIGKYTVAFYDVGTDNKDQYIMWYNGIVNSLRNGNFSAWDFRNGFGMNTMGHHLTEPFLVPVYILGVIFGPEHITHYMVWVEIFRIFVAATLGYWYLSEFDFTERSKLIASVIYAFNGYMMVWGQHYALGSSLVYFPAILLLAERVIRKRKFGKGLCLVCFLTMISSFYQGYMCMFGGGAYVCIRLLMIEDMDLKEKWKAFYLSAGSMILGVVMSAFRFLPSAAAQVGSSERMASQESLISRIFGLKLWSGGIYKTIIYRLFSSCIQGNGNETYVGQKNFYEDPAMFSSTLFIILLLQYLVTIPRQKVSLRNKLTQYFVTGVCAASVVIANVTTLFNGLYKPFFRHTFVLTPIFALLCAFVLDRILERKELNLPALAAAVLGMTAVYLKAYTILPEQQFRDNAMTLWLTGLAMAALLFCYCREKLLDAKTCYTLLVLAVTLNMVSDSYLCYNHRIALPKDHPEYYTQTYRSDVDAALDWIEAQDDTFYRVEKDYFTASSCFDSLAQDYRGISAYNSNQNADIKQFVEQVWPMLNHERDVNHIQFMNAIWDSTFAALTDVKYVLSRSGNMNLEGYEKLTQIGAVFVYKNKKADSLGRFFTKTVTEAQYEEHKGELNARALLTDTLILEEESQYSLSGEQIKTYEKEMIGDIIAEELLPSYGNEETAGAKPLVIDVKLDPGKRKAYQSAILEFNIDAENRTVVKVSIDGGYEHEFVQNWKTPRTVCLELPEEAETVTLTVAEPKGHLEISGFAVYGTGKETVPSGRAEITVNAPEKDSYLTGHISAGEDGYVMLAVPNENGWAVRLNGEEQELVNGDYGFIAFPVSAGEYDMEVIFTAPLLKEGMMLTLAGCLLFVIIAAAGRRKKKA